MRYYTNVRTFGNKVLCRWVESGQSYQSKIDYNPTLFVPSNKPTEYTTLDGKYVKDIKPGTIKDCKDFIKQYEDVHGFQIYGNTKWHYQFISDEYPDEIDWNMSDLMVANIDIEVDSSNGFPDPMLAEREVTSICLKLNDVYYVYACGDYTPKRSDVKYIKCENEHELLSCFLNRWSQRYPDIVTGWYTNGFDIPYLVNRITKIMGEKSVKRLSPWGVIHDREFFSNGIQKVEYELFGISSLDYKDAYQKFTYKVQESYRLDYIAEVELGEKKLDYSEHGNLHTLYQRDFEKFIDYNIKDVELVDRLEKKLRIIELVLTLAYMSKINFEDPFFQVRMWDALIYNELKSKNIQIPQPAISKKDAKYEGAYVKEPRVGLYNWLGSFDLDSLYPHLIMQYNISPEMLVEPEDLPQEIKHLYLKGSVISVDSLLAEDVDLTPLTKYNLTVTPNCQFFRTDKMGFLPQMMENMYANRKVYKKKMLECEAKKLKATTAEEKENYASQESRYKLLQLGMKVTLNSAYGALGNQYFRFFDIRQASAITTAGQLSIRWIEKSFNRYFNGLLKTDSVDYVPYIDTDSNYVSFDALVKKAYGDNIPEDPKVVIQFLDKICQEKIEPFINDEYQKLADYVNAYQQKMSMSREVLADKGIWTGKKRYVLNVHNSEGVEYEEPKLKIMGLEIVRSSTPHVCRDALKEAVSIMVSQDEDAIIKYAKDFKKKFFQMTPEEVAFPRGVNGLGKYMGADGLHKKGTPIHVRGSLLYNKLLVDKQVATLYDEIKEGEKIKFVYLKEPNPLKENVISFVDRFPEEFGLANHIDYELQFTKAFLEPLKGILDCIGWKAQRRGSLRKFKKKSKTQE